MKIIVPYFVLLNLISLIAFGYDKKMAVTGGWRISEKRLFFLALMGGALGIFLGMKAFRHKTKQLLFSYGMPALVMLNMIIIYLLFLKIYES